MKIEGVVQESTERELTTTEIGEMIMHPFEKSWTKLRMCDSHPCI